MRESGFTDILAAGTHVVGHIDVHQRIRVVFVQDDRQSVVELILLVGDDDFVDRGGGYRLDERDA